MSDARETLRQWLQEQVGRPYIWGAKGRLAQMADGGRVPCFDCSGLVTAALLRMGGPDWRQTHSAADLYEACQHTTAPLPMDLCFYGSPRNINHVTFYWGDAQQTLESRVLSASGDHLCTDPDRSLAQGHVVQFKPLVKYRPDFVGFARFPLP